MFIGIHTTSHMCNVTYMELEKVSDGPKGPARAAYLPIAGPSAWDIQATFRWRGHELRNGYRSLP